MPFPRSLSIHTKLSLGFALALGLALAVGGFALLQIRQVNQAALELQEGWLPRVERLGEIRRLATQYRSLITRQARTTNFRHLLEISESIRSTKAAVDAALDEFQATLASPQERLRASRSSTNSCAARSARARPSSTCCGWARPPGSMESRPPSRSTPSAGA